MILAKHLDGWWYHTERRRGLGMIKNSIWGKHPSGDVERVFGYTSPKLREEVRSKDTDL